MNNKTLRIVYLAVLAALIAVFTMFIKVPTMIGYANLGDAVILFGALMFGPVAAISAAVGSAMADLLSGYAVYAIVTFFIKGAMGYVAGMMLKRLGEDAMKRVLAFLAAEVIMVVGYFVFECFYYGFAASLGSVVPNILQGVAGIVVAMVLAPVKKTLGKQLTI